MALATLRIRVAPFATLLLVFLGASICSAFYLPGVAPQDFEKVDPAPALALTIGDHRIFDATRSHAELLDQRRGNDVAPLPMLKRRIQHGHAAVEHGCSESAAPRS